jgi:hypothetical protein
MKSTTRTAKIEAALILHEEALRRFEYVRQISDERGNIYPAAGVLMWAIHDLDATGLVLAKARAAALGLRSDNLSGSGTLAHLSRSEWDQYQVAHLARA